MIFFIDESGHPHPNDPVPCPVLGAVGMQMSETRRLMSGIHSLRKQLLGLEGPPDDDKHLKSSALLNPATHRRKPEKWQYVERVIELAANLKVSSFFIVMERPTCSQVMDEGHIPYYVQFLLERVNQYVEQNCPTRKAPIVFDSRSPGADAHWSRGISSFLFGHSKGRLWTNILETPLFVSSALTPGVQVADYFVGVVRQYWEIAAHGRTVSASYKVAIERMYHSVRSTVVDMCIPGQGGHEGRRLWGEYRMPSKWLSIPG